MGIGDSIKNAAENAMKDLGGTAEPHDDGHLPEPGAPDEDIKVHSTISEASNTMDAAEDERRTGAPPGQDEAGRQARGAQGGAGTDGNILPGGDSTNTSTGAGPAGAGQAGGGAAGEGTAAPPGHVPGPGGLPDSNPDVLRADPTEADEDPSKGMGRG